MQSGEELGQLGLGSGGIGDDRGDRGSAFEPKDDVGCEEPKLLVLVGRGSDRPGPVLLRNRPRVIAADSTAHELSEEVALVPKAGVDGLLRHARLRGYRRDAGAAEAPLLEQQRRSTEHALTRLLGLLEAPFGAVGARLDISGHVHYGIT